MSQRRTWAVGGIFATLGLLVGLTFSNPALEAALGPLLETPPTPEQRDEMFRQLEHEVAELEREGYVLKTVVKLVRPSVVHILAEKRDPLAERFGRRSLSEEEGSGVIVKLGDDHYVLTNRHVIKDASTARIDIRLADGRTFRPVRVWADPATDVAVLKINGSQLVPARLGDSSRVEIGDFVLAVGSPYGLSHSVTHGIISALGRRQLDLGDSEVRYQDFMQTDAAINPGNSGGPLIDLRGRVIGINTAIASSSGANEGVGFSIPINMALHVARQLVRHGSVERAFLGVNLDSKFSASMAIDQLGLPQLQGARIVGITPESPAEQAKLRVGDVVLEFDGKPVDDDVHLVNIVSLTQIGKEATVVVWRDKQPITLKVKVGDRRVFERSR